MEIDQKLEEEKTVTIEKLLAEVYCFVEQLEQQVRADRHRCLQKTETYEGQWLLTSDDKQPTTIGNEFNEV